MLIASWNINSIRVRLPQVLQWMESAHPDVLALQETKTTDDVFPSQALQDAGYHVIYSGQKTYNGVALLSRDPPSQVVTDLSSLDDPQRRIIAATVGDLRIYNVYVPNGQAVGTDKFEYKLRWLAALRDQLTRELEDHSRVLVVGDFNVAPDDRDVHDPAAWAGQVLVSEPEREALGDLLALGFRDTFRLFEQPEGSFREVVNLMVDAGYKADQMASPGTASLSMNLLDEGTKELNSLQISEKLQLLGASLSTSSNQDISSVYMNTLKPSLEASLELFADVVLHPSFPQKEFERLQQQQINAIKNEKAQPISMALRTINKYLYGDGHPYSNPYTGTGFEETVEKLTREDVVRFYQTWFKPNNATLVVVVVSDEDDCGEVGDVSESLPAIGGNACY